MTAEMIGRRPDGPRGADRVIVSGLCAGDLRVPAARLGVPWCRVPRSSGPGLVNSYTRDALLADLQCASSGCFCPKYLNRSG